MRATNPITVDGVVYDHLSINLAITYRVIDADNGDAQVAMRVVPTRVTEDGEVVTADAAAIGFSIATLNGVDPDAAAAADGVFAAVQAYLVAKGI